MNRHWLCWIVVAAVALSGCGGDSGGSGGYGMVMGTVKDLAGATLGGVSVTVPGHDPVLSNEQGWFSVSEIEATDRLSVSFSKPGYVPTADIIRIRDSQSTYLEAVMAPVGSSTAINGAAGGTAAHLGGSVTIAPNTLVDGSRNPFAGAATVTITTFDPTDPAQQQAFPGEFVGIALNGEKIPIVSYGFLDVTVTDGSGNELQLASGSTAAISIPIPASLQAGAPATMPLWHFNTDIGSWEEKGTLTLQGGAYVGTIPHFSVWNSDVGANRSYVEGRVVDSDGNPVEGARVEIRGISPRNCWNSGESSTSADGTFRIPVDANSVCEIFASKNGVKTTPAQFTAAGPEGTMNYGDIVLSTEVPKVTISLTWGAAPADLDSHLLVPTGEHVMYNNKNTGGAKLDTDDRSGYGPEVITIYSLRDGVYSYLVHDFSRSGTTISASGASVTMVVEGKGIYTLTPPSGATSGAYWKLWDITVANKKVVDVQQVSTYADAAE